MFHLLLVIIYLAFISLGLPDSLLGSAWPSIYPQFNVPVSYAGIISTIIALGTIISSLFSDRLTNKFKTNVVTAVSVLITAIALFGFSISHSFIALCLWAIPYGLGAGCIDAALNNYVALNYHSKHMNWLHCMWGIGASLGPYIMGYALSVKNSWNMGYGYISIIQFVLAIIIFISLPLWKKDKQENEEIADYKPLSLANIIKIPGAKEIMITFFCYCAIENTTGLWASSFLVLRYNISATMAANYASFFYIGITIGRVLSGFLSIKFNDKQMIRLGQFTILLGIILLFISIYQQIALIAIIIIGLGCAPIYPAIIHSTPENFGKDKSQAIIGVEMASAYIGTCLMPPLFGIIAQNISATLFPIYLLIILVLMIIMYKYMLKKVKYNEN